MPKKCEGKYSFSCHNNENEVNGEANYNHYTLITNQVLVLFLSQVFILFRDVACWRLLTFTILSTKETKTSDQVQVAKFSTLSISPRLIGLYHYQPLPFHGP